MTESERPDWAVHNRRRIVAAITKITGGPGQDMWVDADTADDIADAVLDTLRELVTDTNGPEEKS